MSGNSTKKEIIIGSRESQLAMIQSKFVQTTLQTAFSNFTFPITGMTTTGDQILDVSLNKIGSKSLFTKELEVALDQKAVDLVVHSLKDLPTTLPAGMALAAVMEREDPRDCVIMSKKNHLKRLETLAPASVIGTSSVRRIAQLSRSFPHLKFMDVRGNLNTRLKKLDDEAGPYDALLLAYAGVHRMGWDERITQILDDPVILHAVGQGALGIECRQDDDATLKIAGALDHLETRLRCSAERSFMRELEGGCSVPLGVSSRIEAEDDGFLLHLVGSVTSLDGKEQVRHSGQAQIKKSEKQEQIKAAELLGIEIANALKSKGAVAILAAIPKTVTI